MTHTIEKKRLRAWWRRLIRVTPMAEFPQEWLEITRIADSPEFRRLHGPRWMEERERLHAALVDRTLSALRRDRWHRSNKESSVLPWRVPEWPTDWIHPRHDAKRSAIPYLAAMWRRSVMRRSPVFWMIERNHNETR